MCHVEYFVGLNKRHMYIPRELAERAIACGYRMTILD